MNKKFKLSFIGLFILLNCNVIKLNAQSLAQQVIASAGGFQSNIAGSLSYTIGETNTKTLSTSAYILTQGFQQPLELHLLNVKAFLQGYYISAGQMQDVLYHQGEYAGPTIVTDSITVELHHAVPPYALAFEAKSIIHQDGSMSIRGLGIVGESYYITLKHRSCLETWSAQPILIQHVTTYNFSTAAAQAFGDNQLEVESGIWAIYSGDIFQDGAVDAFDYLLLDVDLIAGASGYLSTDLTGDGFVDAFDYLVLDPNLTTGIGAIMP
jgi:hypothetical protein